MYRLFTINNNKKSKVKGFWVDNNKIYIDNIFIKKYSNYKDLNKSIKDLFKSGELAVFYKIDLWAYLTARPR